MGDLEFRPWGFYTTGGFLALLGWFIGLADSFPGNSLLVIGLAIIAIGTWRAVGDSKKRRIEQEWIENKRKDDERSREVRLARENEVAEKWWRDHHRGLWDSSYKPGSLALPRTSNDEVSFPDLRPASVTAGEEEWLNNRSKPSPQLYGVSSRGAEKLAAEWLTYLGEQDVQITQYSNDGGVDVLTRSYCCQVKNYEKKPVGVVDIRALLGTAVSRKLKPLLFTNSKLTNDALVFSNENRIAVIEFSATDSTLSGITYEGQKILDQGRYK